TAFPIIGERLHRLQPGFEQDAEIIGVQIAPTGERRCTPDESSSSARSAEPLNGFFMAQLPSSSCIPYEACRAAGSDHRLVNLLIRLPEPQPNLRKYNYHIGGFAAPPDLVRR